MKLSTKLILTMSILTLLIIVIGTFSLSQLALINTSTNEIALEWLPKTRGFGRLNTLTSDFRVQEIMHVLADDKADMDMYERNMSKLLEQIEATKKPLAPLLATGEGKRLFQAVDDSWKEYQRLHESIQNLSLDSRNEEALDLLQGKSRLLFEDVGNSLVKLNDMTSESSSRIADETDVMYSNSLYLISSAIIFAVLFALVLLVFLVYDVKRQLGKDPADLGKIAERVVQGDYDIDDNSPKMGVYAKIVLMVEALKLNIDAARNESLRAQQESVKAQQAMQVAEEATHRAESAKREGMLAAASQLEEIVGIVASASEELSVQIEHSEMGANQSSARMAETATAMEEMNSTVIEVARNAAEAFNLSKQTREKAVNGEHLVELAVSSVQKVQNDSISLKADMIQLSENAQSINQIMSVISDIADQTNLLALNAAIEAARAGEAGRGFAVVADEVRKLAEKTMISTTDVGNAIRAIQNSAAKSMSQVDTTVQNIEISTTQAINSGKALKEIVEMVDRSADQVNAIATASEEQSATSEEINRSVAHVNTITAQTSSAMREAAKAVSELTRQSQILEGLIGTMKNQS